MIVAFIVVVAVVVLGERQNRFSKMETISVVSMRFFFFIPKSGSLSPNILNMLCCAWLSLSLSLSLYIKEVLQ